MKPLPARKIPSRPKSLPLKKVHLFVCAIVLLVSFNAASSGYIRNSKRGGRFLSNLQANFNNDDGTNDSSNLSGNFDDDDVSSTALGNTVSTTSGSGITGSSSNEPQISSNSPTPATPSSDSTLSNNVLSTSNSVDGDSQTSSNPVITTASNTNIASSNGQNGINSQLSLGLNSLTTTSDSGDENSNDETSDEADNTKLQTSNEKVSTTPGPAFNIVNDLFGVAPTTSIEVNQFVVATTSLNSVINIAAFVTASALENLSQSTPTISLENPATPTVSSFDDSESVDSAASIQSTVNSLPTDALSTSTQDIEMLPTPPIMNIVTGFTETSMSTSDENVPSMSALSSSSVETSVIEISSFESTTSQTTAISTTTEAVTTAVTTTESPVSSSESTTSKTIATTSATTTASSATTTSSGSTTIATNSNNNVAASSSTTTYASNSPVTTVTNSIANEASTTDATTPSESTTANSSKIVTVSNSNSATTLTSNPEAPTTSGSVSAPATTAEALMTDSPAQEGTTAANVKSSDMNLFTNSAIQSFVPATSSVVIQTSTKTTSDPTSLPDLQPLNITKTSSDSQTMPLLNETLPSSEKAIFEAIPSSGSSSNPTPIESKGASSTNDLTFGQAVSGISGNILGGSSAQSIESGSGDSGYAGTNGEVGGNDNGSDGSNTNANANTSSSTGTIVGSVVGSVCGIFLIVAGFLEYKHIKQKKAQSKSSDSKSGNDNDNGNVPPASTETPSLILLPNINVAGANQSGRSIQSWSSQECLEQWGMNKLENRGPTEPEMPVQNSYDVGTHAPPLPVVYMQNVPGAYLHPVLAASNTQPVQALPMPIGVSQMFVKPQLAEVNCTKVDAAAVPLSSIAGANTVKSNATGSSSGLLSVPSDCKSRDSAFTSLKSSRPVTGVCTPSTVAPRMSLPETPTSDYARNSMSSNVSSLDKISLISECTSKFEYDSVHRAPSSLYRPSSSAKSHTRRSFMPNKANVNSTIGRHRRFTLGSDVDLK